MMDTFSLRQRLDGRSRPKFSAMPVNIESFHLLWRGHIADPACIDKAACFSAAYTRWHTELARHVFGEYAVVLYDDVTNTLFATHDDFGIVPLFYAEVAGELFVSTDLGHIVRTTGVRLLDEEFIADYIGEGWHFGSRTPYAHIQRLKPGESLICRDGTVRILTGIPLSEEPLSESENKTLEDRLLGLVAEAVAGSIHRNERVWCELSGGLDSSSILSLAALAKTPNLAAFSFVYGRTTRCDERKWIRIALEAYPVPSFTLDADEMRPFTSMPVYRYAEPTVKVFMGAKEEAYHSLTRRHGVDVVLSGEAGDGVFLGDNPLPYHLADHFRGGRFDRGLQDLQHWAKSSIHKRPSMYWFLRAVLRPSIRHMRHEVLDYEYTEVSWLNPEYAKQKGLRTRGRRSRSMRRSSVAAAGYMEGVTRGAFAAAMSYQDPCATPQFRHPFLYRPLVEFMQRVPWTSQVIPEGDRVLQRRAFQGVLPEPIRARTSKVGGDPWFFNGMRDGIAWQERLTCNALIVARGYADRASWAQAVRDATMGRTLGIRHFLASASLEAWLQELEG